MVDEWRLGRPLAAAIRTGAQLIVTTNLKDFPTSSLMVYDIEAIHPDTFDQQQMDWREDTVVRVAKQHRAALKNPPESAAEYLETLSQHGLVSAADRLSDFEDLI